MPRKPRSADAGSAALVVKDGLRGLRFNLRHGAQSIARKIEETTQRLDDMDGPLARLPRLGEPLAAAARTAAQLVDSADHAASDLLSVNGEYRRLQFRLHPMQHYFTPGDAAERARSFTKTVYWSIRHSLQMRGATDVVVHEQVVHRAFHRLHEEAMALPGQPTSGSDPDETQAAGPDPSHRLAAGVVLELCRSDDPPLLRLTAGADDCSTLADQAESLTLRASVGVVLAGEIASRHRQAPLPQETRAALGVADEIAAGCLLDWRRALHASAPLTALASRLAFTLRHL
jgi:hypothetical protein